MLVYTTPEDLAQLSPDFPYIVLLEDQRSNLCAEFKQKVTSGFWKISNYFDYIYVLNVNSQTVLDPLYSTVRVPQVRIIKDHSVVAKFTGLSEIDNMFSALKEMGLDS